MIKKLYPLFTTIMISSIWGFIVGFLDYRLMVNTAATCTCWIKFLVLMSIVTILAAAGFSFWRFKKKASGDHA